MKNNPQNTPIKNQEADPGQPKTPAINLPKGGGAIRGIGEKFAANPVTGTGSMSVPIAASPGRSGFGPQLSLSYDSGSGNGPFGFGWSLSLPSITRKADKGLPQYYDADESDVFILSGAEDLVPVLGAPIPPRTVDGVGYLIRRYRPRIEGLFARIERWTNQATGEIHWRSISKDNITTLYGKDNNSRIFDPAEIPESGDIDQAKPTRIFSWLICQSYDDKGNAIIYEYAEENSQRIFEDPDGNPITKAHEKNRDDKSRTANRYHKRIKYGNRGPNRDAEWKATDPTNLNDWMFEVVFDYGEGHYTEEEPDAQRQVFSYGQIDLPNDSYWPARQDAFSTYKAGFEVRTYRLCQRVLMFHHFPDELDGIDDYLVRSTDFTYSHEQDPDSAQNPIYTFLQAVTQSGYKRDGGNYLKRTMPPVEFSYSKPEVQDRVETVDAESLENLPIGVDGNTYQWTDLHGEGIPGILTEQADAWYYKRNLSPIHDDRVEFAPLERVMLKPSLSMDSGAQFMDLAGDGLPDLVVIDGPIPGLYEHDDEEGWQSFRPFIARLNRDMRDPNLKFVDLDGDGHADVLITEDDAFVWHASLAEEGFGPAQRVQKDLDEEKGPRLVFADGTQSIYLADLSGDGLTDLVRISNGEVCYWPNLGYCKFGTKVTMDNSPHFDNPDQFDHKRIRLADIDGTGTTDIIYLHRDSVRLYFNQSGNTWSAPLTLTVSPQVNDLVNIIPTDLQGNGTACLVWSSPLPDDANRQMRFVNLMGDKKPHLLEKTINNLGAETRVMYAPSTKFYLQDKRDGKPWITRLPFPVHVVERVETYDHISRNRFVTRYAYHHGYFDGEEREFRGFGMVEQWDTEAFGSMESDGLLDDTTNMDQASHVPPILTKTWFHTGAYLGRNHIADFFAGMLDGHDRGEYYREPAWRDDDVEAGKYLLDDTVLPDDLTMDEEREACRALKGAMIRQEVYALDGTATIDYPHGHPYTVTEQNFAIRCLQPKKNNNKHGVFFTHSLETINYHYERNPADPRISHALTLNVDDYGNVLKSVTIGYTRRKEISMIEANGQVSKIPNPELNKLDPKDQEKQTQTLVTYTENDVTNAIDLPVDDSDYDPDNYRTPLPCETRTYELTGYTPTGPAQRFQASDFVESDPIDGNTQKLIFDNEINYEENAGSGKQRRLIERVHTLYRKNDLTGLLEPQKIESMALPGESFTLAFTPDLLKQVFKRNSQPLLPNPADVLGGQGADQGGYVDLENNGHWWIPTGRVFYSPTHGDSHSDELTYARDHFFLAHQYRDPFGQTSYVTYDSDSANPSRNHNLFAVETKDPVDNLVTVKTKDDNGDIDVRIDYRVLQPYWVTDPNGNRKQAAFDTLGLVVGNAVMGKPGENLGDSLEGFVSDLTQDQIDGFYDVDIPHLPAQNLLNGATTRIIYDTDRFLRTQQAHPQDPEKWLPVYASTLARETHLRDPDGAPAKIQITFSYSDGFGREIQKKIQAEPGEVEVIDHAGNVTNVDTTPNTRWVGSGWTIFNNKGKPVRQYEPFFSIDHKFQFGNKLGVSPVLFYDPAERVIATIHPNNTYEKVVFDPWRQITYDVNDTVAAKDSQTGDPRTDPDITGVVKAYFKTQPASWQTWYQQRIGGAKGMHEQKAAEKADAHAYTPTVAHFDTHGRQFLIVTHNKVICPKHDLDGTEDKFHTRVDLDIEGNQRQVIDALDRIVMRYDYSMAGPEEEEEGDGAPTNRIHQFSMEAGDRWMLNNINGNPIRAWDSRGHEFKMEYDLLLRPVKQFVRGTDPNKSDPCTLNLGNDEYILFEKTEYGEGQNDDIVLNLRTQVFKQSDGAGVVTNLGKNPETGQNEAYDFKGNLLRMSRQVISKYKEIPDWSKAVDLENDIYTSSTNYDALNRPIILTAPDNSVIQPRFNEANLLERLDANLKGQKENGATKWTPFITNIDYDAKGQRTLIEYGCGAAPGRKEVRTAYTYDKETFRLTHLITSRGIQQAADCVPRQEPRQCQDPPDVCAGLQSNRCVVQNLSYIYDPVGNITHIRDDAQQTIFFRNKRVEPNADYTYDAIYRLIEATGREHLGQVGGKPISHSYNDWQRIGRTHPGDGNAMGTYTERYKYDEVGNFLRLWHGADNGSDTWQRTYSYDEPSLIPEDAAANRKNNRLTKSTISGSGLSATDEPYTHDTHGNMLSMPQLQAMHWDFKDQLQMTRRQKINDEDEEGIKRQGEKTYYVYDASGQRVRKVTELANENLKDERIYLGGFEVYRKHSGANAGLVRETLHIMDDKQRIGRVETRNDVDDGSAKQLIRYQFGNHLGSARLELDDQAQVISYEEYTPYGSTSYQAVRSQTETPKRYRYTGKERDEESGLYYHEARYYAPWLGRWVSCEPLKNENDDSNENFQLNETLSLHHYMYNINNPVRYVDPDGRSPADKVARKLFTRMFGKKLTRLAEKKASSRVVGYLTRRGPGLKDALKHIAEHFKPNPEKASHSTFLSKFAKPDRIISLMKQAASKPSRSPMFIRLTGPTGEATGKAAFVIEREFSEYIGEVTVKEGSELLTKKTKILRMITDITGRPITAYPVKEFMETSAAKVAAATAVTLAISSTYESEASAREKAEEQHIERNEEWWHWLLPWDVSIMGYEPSRYTTERRAKKAVEKVRSEFKEVGVSLEKEDAENIKKDVRRIWGW